MYYTIWQLRDFYCTSQFFVLFSFLSVPGLPSYFCLAQGLLANRMVKRVHENLRAPRGPRLVWQLCLTLSFEQRGCSRFFFFLCVVISSYVTVSLVQHLINCAVFYALPLFAVWKTEGQMLSGTCNKKRIQNCTSWREIMPLIWYSKMCQEEKECFICT